tara:strand:+ start:732 stop:905 length:174 start_codon:yes stop_codon:yes gene_type:complete
MKAYYWWFILSAIAAVSFLSSDGSGSGGLLLNINPEWIIVFLVFGFIGMYLDKKKEE